MSPEKTSVASVPGSEPVAPASEVLRTREQAEAYVASVCFKHGPPRLLGVELEWLLARPVGRPPLDLPTLASALGPHAPVTVDPHSPALPLPAGSLVTVEPGGQVELASPPLPDLGSLFDLVESDIAALHTRLRDHELYPRPSAADAHSPPRRLLSIPRYCAMEAAFDRFGPYGRSMMCSTAAVQPCVDLGERPDLPARWRLLHAVGPVLVAAFANSPMLHGRRTGWKSSRLACWWALDPPRTAPPDLAIADPALGYAERVMGAQLLCLRRGEDSWDAPSGVSFADWVAGALPEPPTTDDLDLHLTTMFPPVRPHGHLEVRYIDAQPGSQWVVPVAVLAALLSNPVAGEAALEACLPVADRWSGAAQVGLEDPELARAAATVFSLAGEALPALVPGGPVVELFERALARVLRGRCPADEPVQPADLPGVNL
ncbi:MAG TPA: ergothioneine biosynthesis glutamate--cysteine ligase EgtA [Pseudonocardia sp.]|nr:ergothioneine biosynthesis glutamate--cysteine ligase EgtA [Pseudonocardia sp.]